MKCAFLIPSIIRNDNDMKLLTRLMASIKQHEPMMLTHCFVVDDASTHPKTLEFYEDMQDKYGVQMVYKQQQHSYSSMINAGFSAIMKAGYPYFATVNNDIELTSPIVDILLASFTFSPRIAAVGPLLLYPSGKVQSAGFEVDQYGRPFEYNKHQYFISDPTMIYNTPRCVMGVTGAFQMLKTSTFVPLLGYNEDYLMGFEDVDFCVKAWSKGAWVLFQPNAIAIHAESVTRGRVPCPRQIHSSELFQQRAAGIPLVEINERIKAANTELGVTTSGA